MQNETTGGTERVRRAAARGRGGVGRGGRGGARDGVQAGRNLAGMPDAVRAAGRWPLAAGRWPLAAGRWPLAAGRWPLAAGRWPLAAGRWPLAAGRWPLAAGRWPLAAGRWPLAAGRWPLAAGRWPLAAGRWPLAAGRWPIIHARIGCRCQAAGRALKRHLGIHDRYPVPRRRRHAHRRSQHGTSSSHSAGNPGARLFPGAARKADHLSGTIVTHFIDRLQPRGTPTGDRPRVASRRRPDSYREYSFSDRQSVLKEFSCRPRPDGAESPRGGPARRGGADDRTRNPGLSHAGPAGAVSRPRWRPLPLHGGARESPATTRVPKALEVLPSIT